MKRTILFIALFMAVCLLKSWATTTQPLALGKANIYKATFPATSQVTVSTTTSINPMATYMVVESTGGQVIFTITSNIPAISTSTALNGDYLVLFSTTSTSTIFISTNAATAIIGDDSSIVISSTKSAVSFIYNSTLSQWVEIGKQ